MTYPKLTLELIKSLDPGPFSHINVANIFEKAYGSELEHITESIMEKFDFWKILGLMLFTKEDVEIFKSLLRVNTEIGYSPSDAIRKAFLKIYYSKKLTLKDKLLKQLNRN